jgi:hypothetical protein
MENGQQDQALQAFLSRHIRHVRDDEAVDQGVDMGPINIRSESERNGHLAQF